MKGVLLHYQNDEWVEMHYWLDGTLLKISKTDNFDENCEQIEIDEKTNVTLIDRGDQPCFLIENEKIGGYKLKANPSEVYSWVFSLRRCLCQNDCNFKPENIRPLSQLGTSPYGISSLCEYENSLYVMNQFSKQKLAEYGSVESYVPERNLIFSLPSNPFMLNLCYSFQDEKFFYILLEYPGYGDLLSYLTGLTVIPEEDLVFYMAEILVALEFLHQHFIVFRDLCPANILLTKDGHIKLGAYGQHKSITGEHSESEYLAPEVIENKKYDHKADWWSLGVILYQILFDETPFIGADDEETKDNILNKKLVFRRFRGSPKADLILQLLEKDPEKRIDAEQIKQHPFFNSINWDTIRARLGTPSSFNESTPVDLNKMVTAEFKLDSECLPTITGIDQFSFGNDSSNDN